MNCQRASGRGWNSTTTEPGWGTGSSGCTQIMHRAAVLPESNHLWNAHGGAGWALHGWPCLASQGLCLAVVCVETLGRICALLALPFLQSPCNLHGTGHVFCAPASAALSTLPCCHVPTCTSGNNTLFPQFYRSKQLYWCSRPAPIHTCRHIACALVPVA